MYINKGMYMCVNTHTIRYSRQSYNQHYLYELLNKPRSMVDMSPSRLG